MSKVTLSGHIEVPAVELAKITVALEKHMALTREEPGCIVFEVVQDSEEPTMFTVYEEFVDQAAFDSHQNRVLASSWSEATKNVVRHYKVTVEESIQHVVKVLRFAHSGAWSVHLNARAFCIVLAAIYITI